jgi:hypothetical protein
MKITGRISDVANQLPLLKIVLNHKYFDLCNIKFSCKLNKKIIYERKMEMATRWIYYDKTEIVVMVAGKRQMKDYRLPYNDVKSIVFEKCKEFRFFRNVPSECIKITSPKFPGTVTFSKFKHKKYFEEYKRDLKKFAVDNKITFSEF